MADDLGCSIIRIRAVPRDCNPGATRGHSISYFSHRIRIHVQMIEQQLRQVVQPELLVVELPMYAHLTVCVRMWVGPGKRLKSLW